MSKPKLLMVDDDESILTQLRYALRDDYAITLANDRPQAMARFKEARPELVSLDLGLPPDPRGAAEGLKALEEILALAPSTRVIVVTGNGDREHARRAVQLGAFDYHLKPINLPEFKVVLQRAAYLHSLQLEAEKQLQPVESGTRFEDILGTAPKIREIFGMVTRLAKTDATVLIQGESGTGKELLARATHARSARRGRDFVPINCGAIPETLLESELFGHEKGAFTGADVQRKGKIETAEGGTLFLDEIGEMSLPLQVKLLRFLQERTIERVGGRQSIAVNVRIIAATNKDLKAEIQARRFREDLYYRLSVVTIVVPPLRERGEDVVLLANEFLRRSGKEYRRDVRLSSEALQAIAAYAWPGNIRELENTIRRAVIMARKRVIEPGDLGIEPGPSTPLPTLREARSDAERTVLVDALTRTRGNITQAARDLGISRPTFHWLLEKHQVDGRQFR